MSTLSTLEANNLKGALEALLLVSSDPVSAPALAGALDIAPGECASLLAELKVEYEEANRGFQLREVAGGWRLFTHPAYHDVVEAYVLSWDTQKLSQAALETLAVIAYHQPVTREVVKASAASTPTASSRRSSTRVWCASSAVTPSAVKPSSTARPTPSWKSSVCVPPATCPIWSNLPPTSSRVSLSASV